MDWKSIDGIRAFNRTYLAALNLYNQNYLDSGYTTTEARVMHEIYERKTCSANELLAVIPIDKGYMSRILKKFRQDVYKRQGDHSAYRRPGLLFWIYRGQQRFALYVHHQGLYGLQVLYYSK